MKDNTARPIGKKVDFGDEHGLRPDTAATDEHDVEAQHQSHLHGRKSQSVRRLVSPRHGHHDELDSPTTGRDIHRTDTVASRASSKSQRRRGRAETIAYGAQEMGRTTGWVPGLEPGVDTSDLPPYEPEENEHQDLRHLENLHQDCEIMVVDYSPEQMNSQFLDNDNLHDFLAEPQEDWSQVRWINVNGLSWDVIKELGKHKHLHPLAIEDMMNTKNRTKADWYNDHTYLVLPLQKLVNVDDESDSSDDDSDDEDQKNGYQEYDVRKGGVSKADTDPNVVRERQRQKRAARHQNSRRGAIRSLIKDVFRPAKPKVHSSVRRENLTKSSSFKHAGKVKSPWVPKKVRTLQQYHAGPNEDRVDFMHRHSTLGSRGLGVSMEQVSIFVTADNTVISFFEYSAQDVEVPIMRRLQSKSTILRQSCDGSMLMQSILDTIIDLAIPVTTAYQDAIGDLELAVLTDPDIHESTSLYILTSEIATLRNAIAPVFQLIGSLRDHRSSATALTLPARAPSPSPSFGGAMHNRSQSNLGGRPPLPQVRTARSEIVPSGVTISELTKTYLGDVEDHAQIIQDSYDQMRRNADNLVDLIFNTVSAFQNQAMKQLTIVSAFFLPLTFMTGYFGMNFDVFPGVQAHSDKFFWTIAAPVCAVVFLILIREWISRWVTKWANKTLIRRGRKRRLELGGRR